MNIAQVISRVQRQFGDESGVQVVEADILRWINDAQDEAVLQHANLLMSYTTVFTVANQQQYVLPDDCLDVRTMKYQPVGNLSAAPMKFMSLKEMNEYFGDWVGTNYLGDPEVYTTGLLRGTFRVFPVPDAANNVIQVEYSRYASQVDTAASPIDLPEYYHQYIVEFCLMKAYEMDEEYEVMDRKAQYVQSTLDANFGRDDLLSKEVYPSVVPTSEDYV